MDLFLEAAPLPTVVPRVRGAVQACHSSFHTSNDSPAPPSQTEFFPRSPNALLSPASSASILTSPPLSLYTGFMQKHLRAPSRRPASRFQIGLHPLPAEAVAHHRRFVGALLLLAAVTFSCSLLYRAAGPADFLPSFIGHLDHPARSSPGLPTNVPLVHNSNEVSLEAVLKEAAMVDKTVILTTLNAAWASPNSVLDLFFESFRIGDRTSKLLEHLVIVALDQKAHARCKSVHTHCYALMTEGMDLSGEKAFMTDGYLEMIWRRIDFLRIILEMGYNFIFTDADVMWFRDPSQHFYPDGDFQVACDHFVGNSSDLRNRPNGGFNYVRSSNRTIEFYKFWFSSRENYPGYHDQDVLNFIKDDQFIRDIGLSMKFLDTAYFGGICEPSRDLNKVCTMHANCCIGLKSKLHDLRVMLDDWRMYVSLPPSVKGSQLSAWSIPQNCSLAGLHHQ